MRSCEAAVFLVTFVANIAPPNLQVPYQVSLRHSVRNAHVCSGVIVSPDWILTTARCVYSFHGSGITAAYGSQSYINAIFGQTYMTNDIDMIVIHPKFNKKNFQNDIAMLLTRSEITFQPNVVSSILLPSKPVREGDSVSVYGLNFDKDILPAENNLHPNTLQCKQTSVMSIKECYFRTERLSSFLNGEKTICTRNDAGQGIYKGDLGSPLVSTSGRLVGIASWFTGVDGHPDVYTSIFAFKSWILSIIKQHNASEDVQENVTQINGLQS